jgi:multisubunit Na+/H+ antiporter MnhG subunit
MATAVERRLAEFEPISLGDKRCTRNLFDISRDNYADCARVGASMKAMLIGAILIIIAVIIVWYMTVYSLTGWYIAGGSLALAAAVWFIYPAMAHSSAEGRHDEANQELARLVDERGVAESEARSLLLAKYRTLGY